MIPTTTGAAMAGWRGAAGVEGPPRRLRLRGPTRRLGRGRIAALVDQEDERRGSDAALKEAATEGDKASWLLDEDLVSVDFKGNAHSSILDAPVHEGDGWRFVKFCPGMDHEWGYSSRCVDLMRMLVKRGI